MQDSGILFGGPTVSRARATVLSQMEMPGVADWAQLED